MCIATNFLDVKNVSDFSQKIDIHIVTFSFMVTGSKVQNLGFVSTTLDFFLARDKTFYFIYTLPWSYIVTHLLHCLWYKYNPPPPPLISA